MDGSKGIVPRDRIVVAGAYSDRYLHPMAADAKPAGTILSLHAVTGRGCGLVIPGR